MSDEATGGGCTCGSSSPKGPKGLFRTHAWGSCSRPSSGLLGPAVLW